MAQGGSFRGVVREREKGGVEWGVGRRRRAEVSEGGTEIAGTLFYRVCTQQ